MTFSHSGKYLWVTFYRRSYDKWAQSPSALAIIDTVDDSIVRVMPTGPLPKMVVASEDDQYVAVTHWGDNTVGLIDIQSEDFRDFSYVKHLMRSKATKLDQADGKNRDKNCGRCLRGTVFLEEHSLLIVGEMRGGQLIAFNYKTGKFLGALKGIPPTVRHIEKSKDGQWIYISSNQSGYISKISTNRLVKSFLSLNGKLGSIEPDFEVYVGRGARTIALSPSENLLWVAVSNSSKIVGLDADSLEVLGSISTDSFPVGLAVAPNGNFVASTSQGKSQKGGGNAVNIFSIQGLLDLGRPFE